MGDVGSVRHGFVLPSSLHTPSSDLRDADSRAARKAAHGEFYKAGRPIPADAAAQLGNLTLAVRAIGNLERLADLQRRQFLGVFAPLGRSSERFPWTVDYVLIAYAERRTAEGIDSETVFASYASLSQEANRVLLASEGGAASTQSFLGYQCR